MHSGLIPPPFTNVATTTIPNHFCHHQPLLPPPTTPPQFDYWRFGTAASIVEILAIPRKGKHANELKKHKKTKKKSENILTKKEGKKERKKERKKDRKKERQKEI